MATPVGNTLYLGSAASIQSYSDGKNIAVFPLSTTVTIEKTPVNSTDAVNKLYIDSTVSTLESTVYTLAGIDASSISNLNSLLLAYENSDIASYIQLSSSVSNIISTATALSTGLVTEKTRATNAEASLSTGLLNEINSRISSVTSETVRASSAETALSTGLAAIVTVNATQANSIVSLSVGLASEISTRILLSSALVATNASVVNLSSAITSETTRATNAEASLSTGLSNEISSRISSVTSETVRASNAETSLSVGLSNEISSRISSVTSETVRASSAETALSTGLAAAVTVNTIQTNSIVSLSTGLSNEISSRISAVAAVNTSLIITNASVGLLSSALALETTRATNVENSLTSSISTTNVSLSITNNSVVSLSTGLAAAVTVNTTQTNSIVSLSTSASTINVNLSIVQRMNIRTQIVPITTTTIVTGSKEPIYISTYPNGTSFPVDGWRYYKPVSNTTDYINWGNRITNSTGVTSTLTGANLVQIYFTCHILTTPGAVTDLPFLTMTLSGTTFNFAMSSITGITAGNSYTFVANLNGGGTNLTNYFNSSIQTLSLGSFVYASNSANTLSFISVRTNPASTAVNFILQDIQSDVQSNGNANILSGTYQLLFMNSNVNDKYMYNATNYLYSIFFRQPMLSIVTYNS